MFAFIFNLVIRLLRLYIEDLDISEENLLHILNIIIYNLLNKIIYNFFHNRILKPINKKCKVILNNYI